MTQDFYKHGFLETAFNIGHDTNISLKGTKFKYLYALHPSSGGVGATYTPIGSDQFETKVFPSGLETMEIYDTDNGFGFDFWPRGLLRGNSSGQCNV